MRYATVSLRQTEMDPEHVASLVAAELERHVVVHISPETEIAEPLPFWENVIRRLGTLRTVGEDSATGARLDQQSVWMDVRFDPRYQSSFRHFNTAQPLHTDGAYEEEYPATAFFYCAKQAPSGGATLFVDTEDLVRVLQAEMPSLFERLISTEVRFSKLGGTGKTCRIIDFDAAGPRVNWNYYRVAPDQPPAVREMTELFHQTLASRFVDRGEVLPLRLEENESVFFDDRRVLHGRHAYEAKETGDRLIWKCYFALRERSKPATTHAAA